jgi:DNA polymerase I
VGHDPPLLAVDGDNVFHRAYHALPGTIRDAEGRPAQGTVGFGNQLLRLRDVVVPRTMFVAFDTPREPTYRHELLPTYQGGRDFVENDELMHQLDRCPALVEALGLPWAKQAGYEADDFLAAAVATETRAGGSTVVFSMDRDLFQLVSSRTTLLQPRRGGELDSVGPEQVRERYGVEPSQVPDFIALRGDPSDKIPGAAGIGPGKAAVILQEHGTLEAALAAGRLSSEAEMLRAFRQIATLRHDAPLPPLPDAVPDWARAADLTESWGLGALTRRLRERSATTEGG